MSETEHMPPRLIAFLKKTGAHLFWESGRWHWEDERGIASAPTLEVLADFADENSGDEPSRELDFGGQVLADDGESEG